MWKQLGAVILFFFCLVPAVRGQHRHDKEPSDRIGVRPPVTYAIHALLKPESLLVRAEMEIDYRNTAGSTLADLPLIFSTAGTNSHIVGTIDSVLVNGEPIPNLRHDTAVTSSVRLPSPLRPGESTHLLLSFTGAVSTMRVSGSGEPVYCLSDWYPRIAGVTSARCAVALTVDSSFLAAGTGELVNEKEVFGVLPRYRDTILVDPPGHVERLGGLTLGRSAAEGGRRVWIWRSEQSPLFSAAASRDWTFDRIVSDSVTVNIFRGKGSGRGIERELGRDITRLVKAYDSIMGRQPLLQKSLVDGVLVDPEAEERFPLVLSARNSERGKRLVSIALKLANEWCLSVPTADSSTENTARAAGAHYLTSEGLHAIDPADGYDLYSHIAERQNFRQLYCSSFPAGKPFGWFDRVRAPRSVSRADTLAFLEWFGIPAHLFLLRQIQGESRFRSNFALWLAQVEGDHASDSETLGFPDDSTHVFNQVLIRIDNSLADVKSKVADTGVLVTGKIKCEQPLPLPMSLAFVLSSRDTVFQTIESTGERDVPFSFRLTRRPAIVILDLHHVWPDAHRNNNYFFFERGAWRGEDEPPMFPGYRHLTLSDH
jgi:hypothetical protein